MAKKKKIDDTLPHVVIYTDGSYLASKDAGGCCAFVKFQDKNITVVYGESKTTNNRMELLAIIIGLNILIQKCKVDIYSDSQYAINPFKDGYIHNWKRNGWKTSTKTPVKNQDLWNILVELVARHDITFHWVKGHSSDEYNIYVDHVACEISNNLKKYGFDQSDKIARKNK